MKKRFKTIIAIAVAFAVVSGNSALAGTISADAADVNPDVRNGSFVIENGEVNEELSSEDIVIEKYDDILEYSSATYRLVEENWEYAPETYDREGLSYISNCVILRANADASFTVDAEHVVTVIQYTGNNSFYIQYDSEEAAREGVKTLRETQEIRYAEQDNYFYMGFENPAQQPISLPFFDVAESDWFYPAVKVLYREGTMVGGTGFFWPYESVPRAQFALIVYRMEEEPEFTTEKKLHDISGDEWYGKAVLWAAENGVVTGYENGYFGPFDGITREQMAVMLYRYAKYKGYDVSGSADFSTYKDAGEIQEFAEDGMNWAVASGIIKGKDLDGDETAEILQPQGSASRAECAVMIQRFMEIFPLESGE